MINKLKNIMKNITPQKRKGVMKSFEFKNKQLHDFIISKTNEYKTVNNIHTIYWLINDITEVPICKQCDKKKRIWLGYDEGYHNMCTRCAKLITYEKTMMKRYGVKNPMHLEKNKEKIKQTMMEKHGVDCIFKVKEFKEKSKKTMLEKFGVEHSAQRDNFNELVKETLIKNHATEDGSLDEFYKQRKVKSDKTNIEKYGETHYLKTEEGKKRVKDGLKEKYGEHVNSVMDLDWVREKVSKALINDDYLKYVNDLIEARGYILLSEYKHAHKDVKVQCKKCNHIFDILWNYFQQYKHGKICPKCFPYKVKSRMEEEISNYIKNELDINISENSKSIIKPFELDIYIPNQNKAIEYCGLRYHSSGGYNAPGKTNSKYHLNKLNMCSEKDIDLITIFEDEYLLKKDIVLSKIKLFLNYRNDLIKIRGNDCDIKDISYDMKHKFFKEYHLQGDKITSNNIGLFYKDKLLSIMTFSKLNDKEYELARYCCSLNYIIYGGARRLLNYFKNNNDWKLIITYADRRWSTGKLYYNLGFDFIRNTDPNYWYWGNKIAGRKHRLNYSKNKLKNMKNYREELTEFQIMSLEGFSWIYDCGNIRFEMKNK